MLMPLTLSSETEKHPITVKQKIKFKRILSIENISRNKVK